MRHVSRTEKAMRPSVRTDAVQNASAEAAAGANGAADTQQQPQQQLQAHKWHRQQQLEEWIAQGLVSEASNKQRTLHILALAV